MSDAVLEEARLVDVLAGREFVLVPSDDIDVDTFDIAAAAVREVADVRTDRDGTDDRTSHVGASAVTIGGAIWGSTARPPATIRDELAWFCHPGRRPLLVYREVGGDTRRARLRADAYSRPLTAARQAVIDFSASWKVPAGIHETDAETIAVVSAGADTEAGRTYPLVFPRSYPPSDPIGSATVVNAGNVAADPILRLYGPATGPRIECGDAAMVFTDGLVLAAGDYVEIDVAERTVRLNSLPDQSRYTLLDFTASTWWQLAPGDNAVRYFPLEFSSPAQAEIRFRSAWMP